MLGADQPPSSARSPPLERSHASKRSRSSDLNWSSTARANNLEGDEVLGEVHGKRFLLVAGEVLCEALLVVRVEEDASRPAALEQQRLPAHQPPQPIELRPRRVHRALAVDPDLVSATVTMLQRFPNKDR